MKNSRFKSEKSKKRTLRKRNPYFNSILKRNSTQFSFDNSKLPNDPPLIAPNNFSILNNHEETLRYFDNLNDILISRKHAYLDMQNIEFITEDAVLYLISRLIYIKLQYPSYHISGNFPSNPKCEQIFFASHFHHYVSTKRKPKNEKDDSLILINGFETDGQLVKKLLDYVSSNICLDKLNSASAYSVITEVLVNSKNHAYSEPNKFNKWWMLAFPDLQKKIVHLTLLDNGAGIPNTIHKSFSDIVHIWKQKFMSINGVRDSNLDIYLIESALKGEFRTRTGDHDRGTGMPTIFEASCNPQIANMVIISNNAYIKLGKNKIVEQKIILSKPFKGTLISWDFIDIPEALEPKIDKN